MCSGVSLPIRTHRIGHVGGGVRVSTRRATRFQHLPLNLVKVGLVHCYSGATFLCVPYQCSPVAVLLWERKDREICVVAIIPFQLTFYITDLINSHISVYKLHTDVSTVNQVTICVTSAKPSQFQQWHVIKTSKILIT